MCALLGKLLSLHFAYLSIHSHLHQMTPRIGTIASFFLLPMDTHVSAPFIEETFLSPMYRLADFVENQLTANAYILNFYF